MTDTVQVPREALMRDALVQIARSHRMVAADVLRNIANKALLARTLAREADELAAAPPATDPRDDKWTAEDAQSLWDDLQHAREQQEAAESRIATLTAERDAALAAVKRLLLEFDFLVESGALPDVRDDIIFVNARTLTTQPSKTETRDDE